MRKLLLILLLFILIIIGLITIFNTLTSFSKQLDIEPIAKAKLDEPAILNRFSEALRIPSVSMAQDTIYRYADEKMLFFLQQAYPTVHTHPNVKMLPFANGKGHIYRWSGQNNDLKPILLLLQTDVKDPDLKSIPQWTYNPFLGKRVDGFIWGAGTMGGKAATFAFFEAWEALLQKEAMPQRSLYVALLHNAAADSSKTVAMLADLLKLEGLEFECILGTESHISEGRCMRIQKPIALLSCAERRILTLNLKGDDREALLERVTSFRNKTFGPKWSGKATAQLMETLTPELPFGDKWVLCNRSLLSRLIFQKLMSDAVLSEMIFSQVEILSLNPKNSKAAEASIQILLSPDEDIPQFKQKILEYFYGFEIQWQMQESPLLGISPQNGFAYELMQSSIRQTMGDVLVFPAIRSHPSKIAYLQGLSPAIYQFSPLWFDTVEWERKKSGVDHRIAEKQYLEAVRFYQQFLSNALGNLQQ